MPSSPKVVGIGHITCDIICPITCWPEPDTKNLVPRITLAGGGPAANAIAALAKLNTPCALVGILGDDLLGRYTLEEHVRLGIDTSHIRLSTDADSPVSVVISDLMAGTRTIWLTKGRGTTLSPAELDWDWLSSSRILHLDGHQMPASLAVAQRAQSWPGCQVVVDAGSIRDGMRELCALSDVVIASLRFVRELTAADEPQAWLGALSALGAKQVGVTAGAQGSYLLLDGAIHHQPAFSVNVQDTTGAGDCFHGGFIYGMLQGYSPQDCLRFASAVAAIKCTGIGARQNLPDREEVVRFLAEANSCIC